jgi:hypothetical protein
MNSLFLQGLDSPWKKNIYINPNILKIKFIIQKWSSLLPKSTILMAWMKVHASLVNKIILVDPVLLHGNGASVFLAREWDISEMNAKLNLVDVTFVRKMDII